MSSSDESDYLSESETSSEIGEFDLSMFDPKLSDIFQWLRQNHEIPHRCLVCKSLFSELHPTPCFVHPGPFGDYSSCGNWLCCNKPYKSEGCHQSAHVLDETTMNDINLASSLFSQYYHTEAKIIGSKSVKKLVQVEQLTKSGEIIHRVSENDTIDSLCLKYDTSSSILINSNNGLNNQNLKAFKHIIVPISDSIEVKCVTLSPDFLYKREQEDILMKFIRVARCTKEEAQSYLSENHFHYEAALDEYIADLEFKQQFLSSSGKSPSISSAIFF